MHYLRLRGRRAEDVTRILRPLGATCEKAYLHFRFYCIVQITPTSQRPCDRESRSMEQCSQLSLPLSHSVQYERAHLGALSCALIASCLLLLFYSVANSKKEIFALNSQLFGSLELTELRCQRAQVSNDAGQQCSLCIAIHSGWRWWRLLSCCACRGSSVFRWTTHLREQETCEALSENILSNTDQISESGCLYRDCDRRSK